jgi:hypothetical protein
VSHPDIALKLLRMLNLSENVPAAEVDMVSKVFKCMCGHPLHRAPKTFLELVSYPA